ncbi:MAG: nuclear transport factor 2 family protein [Gammaproteobacteria bacterium]
MKPTTITGIFLLGATLMGGSVAMAQEVDQYQHWLDLLTADQNFALRSEQIGRNLAFLEVFAEDAVVFRQGPVNARETYTAEDFEGNELRWVAHYIDVSRDGDMGLTAGPMTGLNPSGEAGENTFGHIVSVWRKVEEDWKLAVDLFVFIPGFLSLDVQPSFADTQPVLDETAHPVMVDNNNMQSLIDADNQFGQSINFRGGQRALIRYGMENSRVYLPGMAPAVGADAASSVYGAYLDNALETTNPINLTYMGGYLSSSKDMGYTYGTMAENTEGDESGFRTNYLRLWRFTESNEWRISVEVLRPY